MTQCSATLGCSCPSYAKHGKLFGAAIGSAVTLSELFRLSSEYYHTTEKNPADPNAMDLLLTEMGLLSGLLLFSTKGWAYLEKSVAQNFAKASLISLSVFTACETAGVATALMIQKPVILKLGSHDHIQDAWQDNDGTIPLPGTNTPVSPRP